MEAEIKGRNELSRIIYPAMQIPGDAWMKLQAEDQKRSDDLNCRLPRAWMILNWGVQQRVEEFIEEIEGPPATRDVTRWSQFSDIRDIKKRNAPRSRGSIRELAQSVRPRIVHHEWA
jgi:hypothetical protein